jgi:hypothetical protein
MSYVEVIRENGAKKGLKKYNKRVSSSWLLKGLCYFSGFYKEVIKEYAAKKSGEKKYYTGMSGR